MRQHWLEDIEVSELVALAPPLAMLELGAELSIEEAAAYLYKGGPQPPNMSVGDQKRLGLRMDNRPPRSYWEQVKVEVYRLICTNESSYAELRSQLEELGTKSKTPLAAVISAYIGETAGLPAAALTGLCAVALYGVIKIGREAYCNKEQLACGSSLRAANDNEIGKV